MPYRKIILNSFVYIIAVIKLEILKNISIYPELNVNRNMRQQPDFCIFAILSKNAIDKKSFLIYSIPRNGILNGERIDTRLKIPRLLCFRCERFFNVSAFSV